MSMNRILRGSAIDRERSERRDRKIFTERGSL